MSVPLRLQNPAFRFCLLEGKKPLEKNWTATANYPFWHPRVVMHQWSGGNIGICGGFGNLQIIDFDSVEAQQEILPKLPETFQVMTGGKGLLHVYLIVDNPESWKILDAEGKTVCDAQGIGKQCVTVGSIHPDTKRKYVVWNNAPIARANAIWLKELFSNYIATKGGEAVGEKVKNRLPVASAKGKSRLMDEARAEGITVKDVLEYYRINVQGSKACCPFHDDKEPSLSFNTEVWNCFGCGAKGNIVGLVRKLEAKQNG